MMLTLFPLQSVFYPQPPTPFKVSMIFINVAILLGHSPSSIMCKRHKGGNTFTKLTYHRRYFYNLPKKVNQLPPHQLIGR